MRVACLILVLAAPALAALRPASRPVDALALEARDAVRNKTLPGFATRVEEQLKRELAKDEVSIAEIARLTTFHEFARYFARVNETTDGHADTLAWLATQPDVLPSVVLTVTRADPPERVLEVLRALRADHRHRIEEFPDLAAAVCVVWDAPDRFGGDANAEDLVAIDPAVPSRVFEHFTRSADRLALDPRRVPLDLLVFIVDLRVRPEEIAWATRYGARPNVAAAFLAVPYSESVEYDRATAEMTDRAYLLPNILRRGGRLRDAAYFAAEIAKANGVPAAACRGSVDEPQAAWAAFLQFGSRPTWDATSARHASHQAWVGVTQDPQTYEWRSEAELTVLSGVLATSPRDRLTSMALFKSSALVELPRRFILLKRAIEIMPANRHAWYALADLAATEKLDAARLEPIERLLTDQLDRRWPEFATVLRLRMLKGRGTMEFDRGIDRVCDAAGGRTELVAMARLVQVARYEEDKKFKESIELLVKLLQRRPPLSPPSALAVMRRLDELLHRENDLPRLAEIYRQVHAALPRPTPSKHARETPYYRIGRLYAALLDEMKSPQAAATLRSTLETTVIPAPAVR